MTLMQIEPESRTYSLRMLRAILVSALIATVLVFAGETRAENTMCIPVAFGVPGLAGAPRWWDQHDGSGNPIPSYDTTDPQWDPRWRGARGDGFGGGGNPSDDVRFRALYHLEPDNITYLYLTWFVHVAPSFSSQQTSLYVGLSPTVAAATGSILTATFFSDTGAAANASSTGTGANYVAPGPQWGITLRQGNGTTNWTTKTPPWVTDLSANKLLNTARGWANPNGSHQWAINLRIPLDPTGPVGTNGVYVGDFVNGSPPPFLIWFYVQPDITLIGNMIGYIPYTWPRTTADVTTYVVDQQPLLTFPDPSTWGTAVLQSAQQNAATCQNGVYLSDNAIGTAASPAGPLLYTIDAKGPNIFVARPDNYSTAPVPSQTLHARFRIAAWGAQVGTLTNLSWLDVPGQSAVQDTGGIVAIGGGNPGHGNIFSNPPENLKTDPQARCLYCALEGNAGDPTNCPVPGPDPNCPNPATPQLGLHQCILVTLSGAGIDFQRDSAFTNMNFIHTSRYEEAAEVSVKGLPSLGSGRDVYIFLELQNMPSFPTIGYNTPPPPTRHEQLTTVGGRQQTVAEAAASVMPTYVAHAYYDTGKKVKIAGIVHPLYQPLTSFGLFAQHDGVYFGWQAAIEGATEIAPRLYKVNVANDSAVKVIASVNTIDLTTWWIWLILLVIILFILLLVWALRRLVHP